MPPPPPSPLRLCRSLDITAEVELLVFDIFFPLLLFSPLRLENELPLGTYYSVQLQVASREWSSARRGRINTAAAFASDEATLPPIGLGFSGDCTRGHTRASTALGAASITGDKQVRDHAL